MFKTKVIIVARLLNNLIDLKARYKLSAISLIRDCLRLDAIALRNLQGFVDIYRLFAARIRLENVQQISDVL